MQVNWTFIKGLLCLLVMIFLYGFSSYKNNARPIVEMNTDFEGLGPLFINHEVVNKLLIQKPDSGNMMRKDTLDLNRLEHDLRSHDMVKNAQVYLTISGQLKVEIQQRKPIARVYSSPSVYIDDEGSIMPLSPIYSARAPMVTGFVDSTKLDGVYKIASAVSNDAFLKMHVIEIQQDSVGYFLLKIRALDWEVELGDLSELEQKITKFKAFYQKAKKEDMLHAYSRINLKFKQQVVCTKK
jgi:cell division protein FtsQ